MTSTIASVAPAGSARGCSVGVVIGYFGWLLGTSVVCALAGAWGLLGEAWLVGGPLTAALLAQHCFAARLATRSGLGAGALAGVVLVDVGILLVFANLWLMPRLAANAAVAGVLHSTASLQHVPDWLPLLVLAVGVAWLTRAAARVR